MKLGKFNECYLNTTFVLNKHNFDSVLREKMFSGRSKSHIFPDHHTRNLVQQRCSGAHDARAERVTTSLVYSLFFINLNAFNVSHFYVCFIFTLQKKTKYKQNKSNYSNLICCSDKSSLNLPRWFSSGGTRTTFLCRFLV